MNLKFFQKQTKVHFIQDKYAVDNLKEKSKKCAYIDNIFIVEMAFHIISLATTLYTIIFIVKEGDP